MEETLEDTDLEELDTGIQQLQTGVSQLQVTGQALNSTAADGRPNSRSWKFQFDGDVPKGGNHASIGAHPAHSCLTSRQSDSDRPQQRDGTGEGLQTSPRELSCKPEFKLSSANSEPEALNHFGESKANPTGIEQCGNGESSTSKPLPKKKKKNRTGRSKAPMRLLKEQQELCHRATGGERISKGSTEAQPLSVEEQLRREVDWCIEQLELGLRSQKSSQKQVDEALCALRTLRSGKAPLVKKRQAMRSIFGDYRRRMEEERQKELKLMRAATKSATIKPVEEQTRSKVFRKTANKLLKIEAPAADNPMNPEQTTVDTDQSQFRFNFF
ncbi:UPF0488 protein C8orf33 homolog [Hypanus sabinus]|uniref:UPF0488 protein C8orf33 homolog n=1 Tax=Hypanus sabinus TaxID=79690 RepID=UPI0028C4A479|nr:UPF0488 protein C8orf33 homolog [Hypanus sabinus]XP_059834836.1 UPF0488 protein C8orf33 homolog [Hypanus sabinus]